MINICSNYAFNLRCLDECSVLRSGPMCEDAPVDNLYDGDAYYNCPFFTDFDYEINKIQDISSSFNHTFGLGKFLKNDNYFTPGDCI